MATTTPLAVNSEYRRARRDVEAAPVDPRMAARPQWHPLCPGHVQHRLVRERGSRTPRRSLPELAPPSSGSVRVAAVVGIIAVRQVRARQFLKVQEWNHELRLRLRQSGHARGSSAPAYGTSTTSSQRATSNAPAPVRTCPSEQAPSLDLQSG